MSDKFQNEREVCNGFQDTCCSSNISPEKQEEKQLSPSFGLFQISHMIYFNLILMFMLYINLILILIISFLNKTIIITN